MNVGIRLQGGPYRTDAMISEKEGVALRRTLTGYVQ